MADTNRDKMQKPDFMDDEQWAAMQQATESLERIKGDAHADVERYLANPEGWSTGEGSPSGLPTLLLKALGRKSGEMRTTPLVFMQHGEDMIVVGSLAGYDSHPAWVLNVNANPDCEVQCDHRVMKARARSASTEERADLWPKLVAMFPPWGYFQDQTDRPFAVIILSPTKPA